MVALNELVITVLQPLWGVMAVSAFLGIVLWAFWPKNKGRFEDQAMIPFKENDEER